MTEEFGTLEHLKGLYKSLEEKGLVATLKYDLLVTSIRHPKISSKLVDYFYIDYGMKKGDMRGVAEGIFLKGIINSIEMQRIYT